MCEGEKIYLSTPHMDGKEQHYVAEAFRLNWVSTVGHNIEAFEKGLATYNGVHHALAVNSGTSAIHLALQLLNVGVGDSVFCSSLTFVASANPILYQHATPVLIDAEEESWNMSPQALKKALETANKNNTLPKAVIVVHLFGQSAQMDEIMPLCNFYNVPVIEDAAESLGSTYKGQKSGTHGKFGVYSFNGNKIITTSGGGALISNDKKAIQEATFLSTQARDAALHYQHSKLGYNYRLSNISAGIGRGQLEVLEKRIEQRRKVFQRYYDALFEVEGIHFQPELSDSRSNRWLTAFTVEGENTSKTIIEELANHHIEARPVWKPMHLQPLYQGYDYYEHETGGSVSDKLFAEGVCLPSGSNLTEEQQNKVIDIVLYVLGNRGK